MKSISPLIRTSGFSLSKFKEKLNHLKMRSFRRKIAMEFTTKDFIIKTASSYGEIKAVHELRKKIFSHEYSIENPVMELDFSRYDLIADHIILIHKETYQVAATYRMISSTFSREFYSQTEYDIDDLVHRRANKVELSRACVAPEFRSGTAIALIWKGLARYAQLAEARFLFGLSSMPCTHPATALGMRTESIDLNRGTEFQIFVKPQYRTSGSRQLYLCTEEALQLPPLLETYLNAGAKIYGEPAYDKDFKSLDFFTVLDIQNMSQKYYRRYFEAEL